ncbi:MAG: hypothetical protein KatS3mg110_0608 [Pirellulaceae bacterium]|nr:MAG: hypothetical protein KatS3mg110_0608 [Pirellulaceae bacterium]
MYAWQSVYSLRKILRLSLRSRRPGLGKGNEPIRANSRRVYQRPRPTKTVAALAGKSDQADRPMCRPPEPIPVWGHRNVRLPADAPSIDSPAAHAVVPTARSGLVATADPFAKPAILATVSSSGAPSRPRSAIEKRKSHCGLTATANHWSVKGLRDKENQPQSELSSD